MQRAHGLARCIARRGHRAVGSKSGTYLWISLRRHPRVQLPSQRRLSDMTASSPLGSGPSESSGRRRTLTRTARFALRIAILVLAVWPDVASEQELRTNVFGTLPAPGDSQLAGEVKNDHFEIDGCECSILNRVFWARDLSTFQADFDRAAAESTYAWVYRTPSKVQRSITDWPTAGQLEGPNRLSISLAFYESSAKAQFARFVPLIDQVDPVNWPYVAVIAIRRGIRWRWDNVGGPSSSPSTLRAPSDVLPQDITLSGAVNIALTEGRRPPYAVCGKLGEGRQFEAKVEWFRDGLRYALDIAIQPYAGPRPYAADPSAAVAPPRIPTTAPFRATVYAGALYDSTGGTIVVNPDESSGSVDIQMQTYKPSARAFVGDTLFVRGTWRCK